MDKDSMYYIVQNGTNNRAMTLSHEVLMVDVDNVDRVLGTYSDLYEKMTVTDYEEKFRKVEKK